MRWLTGAAGFIGMHVAERLLAAGDDVLGVDDLNPYYDPALKRARLAHLEGVAADAPGSLVMREAGVQDRAAMAEVFAEFTAGGLGGRDAVVHLAAQAGVRYSLENPHAYADANLTGFLNILEGCRHATTTPGGTPAGTPPHLVYASSSSVYGDDPAPVLRADGPADHPVSLYAATKRANELMAHCYSHLYGIPCTGVRFFTVYGPWGRPDMALWKFTERVLRGEPIDVYGHGKMRRGFTYIDDAAEGVVRLIDAVPEPAQGPPGGPDRGTGPFRTYNLGNDEPSELTDLIAAVEAACGRAATKNYLPMQPGDVVSTAADCTPLAEAVGFTPSTPLREGVGRFVAWYRGYTKS